MLYFCIGFLEGFSRYSLCSLVYTMSRSVILMLHDDNYVTIELCLNSFFHENPKGACSTLPIFRDAYLTG